MTSSTALTKTTASFLTFAGSIFSRGQQSATQLPLCVFLRLSRLAQTLNLRMITPL